MPFYLKLSDPELVLADLTDGDIDMSFLARLPFLSLGNSAGICEIPTISAAAFIPPPELMQISHKMAQTQCDQMRLQCQSLLLKV